MDKLILFQELLAKEDINYATSIPPLTVNKINRFFETAKFSDCQQLIINHVEKNKELNCFMLLSVINCQSLLIESNLEDLEQLFKISTALIIKFASENATLTPLDSLCCLLIGNIEVLFNKLVLNVENKEQFEQTLKLFDEFIEKLASFSEKPLKNEKIYKKITQSILRLKHSIEQENANVLESTQTKLEDIKNENSNKKSESLSDSFASNHWYLLIKKCYLLPKLIKANRFFEAAIVYDDIELSLQAFDPKVYFPGLFFDLFKSLAPVASQLHQYISQHQNSLQWYLSEQLYHSNLDRFIDDVAPIIIDEDSADRKADILPELEEPLDRSLLTKAMDLPEDDAFDFNNLPDDIDDDLLDEKLADNQKTINYHNNALQSSAEELVDSED